MVSLIGNLLGENTTKILQQLQAVGFNAETAQRFLGESGQRALSSLSDMSEHGNLGGKDGESIIDVLKNKIDVSSLAGKLGVDVGQATSGLNVVLPAVVQAFQGGDVSALVSQLGDKVPSGLMGKLKGALGKSGLGI